MIDLAQCTWPEAGQLLGPDVIALVPIGSTAPHGPHLPLDAGVTIAQAQARRAAERFEAAGVRVVIVPSIPFGVTRWSQGFSGSIGLRPGTLWALLEDVVTSLEEHGVRRVIFTSGHLEPVHLDVLRGVPLDHRGQDEETSVVLFPESTSGRWASTLGEEYSGGDHHAGRFESSIILAADPDSVREGIRTSLPAVRVGLPDRLAEGARNFLEAGADQAYCGAPADAAAAEGEEHIDGLANMLLESAREAWPELFA